MIGNPTRKGDIAEYIWPGHPNNGRRCVVLECIGDDRLVQPCQPMVSLTKRGGTIKAGRCMDMYLKPIRPPERETERAEHLAGVV